MDITFTVDLNAWVTSGYNLQFSAPTVQISNGDTVDIAYNFLPGQTLTFANNDPSAGNNLVMAWPWLQNDGTDGNFEIQNIDVNLLDPAVTGTVDTNFTQADEMSGVAHLGPFDTFLALPDSSVTFSGVTATYDVVSVPGGSNPYSEWFNGGPSFNGGQDVTFTVNNAVPDAAPTALLLAAALLGLCAASRLARRTA